MSNINLSLFERAPSTVSTRSSTDPTKISYEQNQEYLLKLKLQQYANICKTDASFNNGNLGSINTLQCSEMNEIMSSIDNLMTTSVRSIDKNDHIIDLSFNSELDNMNLGKSTKKSTTNYTTSEFQNFTDPSISIDGLVQTDLLRNGLKSGPLLVQKEPAEPESKNSKVPKPNLDVIPTLSSQLNYKVLIGNKNKIIFKYFLVLDLNKNHFEFCKMNKMQPLYSIKLVNKPSNWSQNDLEQFTIDIKINEKESPRTSTTLPVIKNNKKNPTPIFTNYLPRKKVARFLNSRSLFDRIYRHFLRVLNYEWNPFSNSNDKNFEKERFCELNDNKLKIHLKWKGVKQKDLEIIIFVDLVVKVNDSTIEKKVMDSMISISNNFFQAGGVFAHVPVITEKTMNYIISWMKRHINCDMTTMYLLPNCVHYWSLNIQPLKQNFLRFLCWVNNFTEKSAEVNILINVLNGYDNSTPTQLRTFFANQLYRQSANYNFSLILVNSSNSALYLINKQLQLFNYLSMSKKELIEKVGNNSQSEDSIIADILFSEINFNASRVTKKNWCNQNVFDLLWSSIMRFRYGIIKCLVPDNFNVYDNVLPNEYIQFIGMQSFNIIPYLNSRQNTILESRSDFFVTKKQLEDNEINKHIESAMKLMLTGILPEEKEKDIVPVPMKSQTNMTELNNRPIKKPAGFSYEATLGGSEREISRFTEYGPSLGKESSRL